MNNIAERWGEVQERVSAACKRSGRDSNSVNVVAVTKLVSVDRMVEAFGPGFGILGRITFRKRF